MRQFFETIVGGLEGGRPVMLVSVVEAVGSTPRGAGALLAVFPDGRLAGSIGGGNVEYEAARMARELLASGRERQAHFRFVHGDAASLGMVCGGDVTLHFQYLPPTEETAAVFRTAARRAGGNENLWLVRRLEGGQVTALDLADGAGFCLADGAPDPELLQSRTVYRDGWLSIPIARAGRLCVFGGGHVSQALVRAAAAVGFRSVVFDDRVEFAAPERFPQAEAVLCGRFDEVAKHLTLTADDYVVVMTRGHQADYEVLTQVLRSGAKYIGCIGSKKKLELCRARLLEAGFTAEEYDRLHAPIGLAIGAETPAEIAVSVTAELIAVRAGVLA
ncbi:MAG: XdhC family protein [Ruminococcaceae bacterium]|nr:XdhC family protein [Oscillospiraceae bacterium]